MVGGIFGNFLKGQSILIIQSKQGSAWNMRSFLTIGKEVNILKAPTPGGEGPITKKTLVYQKESPLMFQLPDPKQIPWQDLVHQQN